LRAQLEVAHLERKDFSATTLGGFLNIGIPVSDAADVTAEFGVYAFSAHDNSVVIVPILAGYRYTLDQSGSGFYIEPFAGYTIGATDISKTDKNGNLMYDNSGREMEQKAQGITSGAGFGYLFQPAGRLVFNLGIRYLHVFSGGDPQPNMFSLRLSHSFSFGRRTEYY